VLSRIASFQGNELIQGVSIRRIGPARTKKCLTDAALRSVPQGREPNEREDACLEGVLRVGRIYDVKTILSSGNVIFTAPGASEAKLERKAEAAMSKHLGREFLTIIRPIEALRTILEADPFKAHRLAPGSKRVVTFLRGVSQSKLTLPIELHGARILRIDGREVFTAYVPSPRGAVFMTLIEKNFGEEVTHPHLGNSAKGWRSDPFVGEGRAAGQSLSSGLINARGRGFDAKRMEAVMVSNTVIPTQIGFRESRPSPEIVCLRGGKQ
jgi:uncharacterized protein (DUF1697 family)